jgi:hypothetical protein
VPREVVLELERARDRALVVEHALEAGDVEFVSCREAARRAREDPDLPRRRLEPVEVDDAVYREL